MTRLADLPYRYRLRQVLDPAPSHDKKSIVNTFSIGYQSGLKQFQEPGADPSPVSGGEMRLSAPHLIRNSAQAGWRRVGGGADV